MTEIVPAWLAAYRENPAAALAQRDNASRARGSSPKQQPRAVAPLKAASHKGGNTYGFVEPPPWKYDGCKRREPVLDMDRNPPRVVRKVGWQRCIACGSPFFSEDVVALRLCDGSTSCRNPKDHNMNWGKPE